MKTKLALIVKTAQCLLLSIFLIQPSTCFAQGTAFTYQGRLDDRGVPATGLYDFTFTVWDADTDGNPVGASISTNAVPVTNGLFTVEIDPGVDVFTGPDRWLEICVVTNLGGSCIPLSPRQRITPTPYAIRAANAGTAATAASVEATNITGTIPLAQFPPSVVTNGASDVSISGTFSGNGAAMTNLSLESLNTLGAITTGSFRLNFFTGGGAGPLLSIVAADVNEDGSPDLICADYGSSSLVVWTNNGGGVWLRSSTPAVGGAPASVAATDVNEDNHVDLISANYGSDTLSILTNDGSGAFTLASSPVVGTAPAWVAAADVNGDGKVDLVCANQLANTLSVLTNDGAGNFALSASLAVAGAPSCVAATDVNGDGKLDLVTANQTADTLSVLTNNGSGGFAISASPAVGSGPFSVVTADVNGDGSQDLISANWFVGSGNTLTILTNNGSGAFTIASSPLVGDGPRSVVAADVNGDGRPELITANEGSKSLSILTNNGAGSYGVSSTLSLSDAQYCVTVADLNGDGAKDLACGGGYQGIPGASVLFNHLKFTGDGSGLTDLNGKQLQDGSVSGAALANGAVTTSKIEDMAVTAAKLDPSIGVWTQSGGNVYRSSGEVGIGTTSPSAALAVSSSGGMPTPQLQVKQTANDFVRLRLTSGSQPDWDIAAGGAGNVLNFFNMAPRANLMTLYTNGNLVIAGTLTQTSDRNRKTDIRPISATDMLEKVIQLPLSKWRYKTEEPGITHVGPMAQDFHAAFGLNGTDDKHIATVDADGVALAAIQGLNEKVESGKRKSEIRSQRTEDRVQKLESENAELKQELAGLKQLVHSLLPESKGGAR